MRPRLAVSSAEEVNVSKKGRGTEYSFNFPHPAQHISVIAGKYRQIRETWKDVTIYSYALPVNTYLAKSYIEYAKKYLAAYEAQLTPYPYKRLSVVEGFQTVSYTMPTVAVIGRDQLPLTFLADSSFGRIMLRQWFGDSIYVDSTQGNWADGLTTYLADQRAEELRGKGRRFRKQVLIDYASFVSAGREYALKDYREAVDLSSGVTGYGKGSMFFHMLKRQVPIDRGQPRPESNVTWVTLPGVGRLAP